MVPNIAGLNEFENMMTSFPFFDAFLFFGRNSPYPIDMLSLNLKRKFKAGLDDRIASCGIGKWMIIRKRKINSK